MEHRSVIPKIKFLSNESDVSKDLSQSVIAFQVQKNMNQLAGSFQLVMVPRQSLESENFQADSRMLSYIYRNVHPMDLISIGVESDGGMMLGVVDNVFRSRTTYNNQVASQIIVRGRDFGKFLIEDNTMFAPSADDGYVSKLRDRLLKTGIVGKNEDVTEHPLLNFFTENRAPKWIDNKGGDIGRTFVGKTISEAISWALKSLSSLRVRLSFDGRTDVAAHELLTIQVSSRDGDQIATQSHNSFIGSIANLIYAILDREFYEVFIETINENAVFIVRPRPYDRIGDKISKIGGGFKELTNSDSYLWTDLRTLVDGKVYHEIPEQDIIQLNMGVSDYETFSMYIHNTRQTLYGIPYEQAGMFYPMMDMFALKRYGLKKRETESSLVPMDIAEKKVKDQTEIENKLRGNRDRIFNWNRYNGILESGTVTVRGHDSFKLGDPVKLIDEIAQNGEPGIKAYLTGYSHSWQYGQPFLSNLQLIRGENEKLIEDYKKLTDSDIVRSSS